MRRARSSRRGGGGHGLHLSISATDAEWEGVRRSAARRGLPISRYLMELVERDGEGDAPSMALAAEEQRELLEAVREIRSLMLEGAETAPLVRDMQERVAVRFRAWATTLARSGRGDALEEALAAVLGAERGRAAAVSLTAGGAAPAPAVDHQERLL